MEGFFFVGYIVLHGFINVHYKQPEFSITMALIPIGLLHIIGAAYCIRSENTFGAIIAIVSSPGSLTRNIQFAN
jgi:hypothetical protein